MCGGWGGGGEFIAELPPSPLDPPLIKVHSGVLGKVAKVNINLAYTYFSPAFRLKAYPHCTKTDSNKFECNSPLPQFLFVPNMNILESYYSHPHRFNPC